MRPYDTTSGLRRARNGGRRTLFSYQVTATREDGSVVHFVVTCRIDTPVEIDYYRNGGILHTVLRQLAGD